METIQTLEYKLQIARRLKKIANIQEEIADIEFLIKEEEGES